MSVNKTILESTELSTGTEVNVHIASSGRGSLGIDGSEVNINVWLTTAELKAIADMINKALEENENAN